LTSFDVIESHYSSNNFRDVRKVEDTNHHMLKKAPTLLLVVVVAVGRVQKSFRIRYLSEGSLYMSTGMGYRTSFHALAPSLM